VRCLRCHADNTVHVQRCIHCNSPLDTPEQRAFNEALWETSRSEKAAEDEEVARLKEARASVAYSRHDALREYGDALARKSEQETLESNGWTRDDLSTVGRPSPGLRLLRMIPDARWRAAVLAIAIVVSLALIFSPRGSGRQIAGFFLVIGLSLLFMPPGARRRRRWWE